MATSNQKRLFGRSILCHCISKYSHSTVFRSSNSGWTHIQASDLFVLVEQLQHSNDMQLRVVQGTNDLEIVPLSGLIKEALDLRRRFAQTSTEDLPILGMTKDTALAIRYACSSEKIRRIQLRLGDVAACKELVQFLSHHGLSFTVPPASRSSGIQSQGRPTSTGSFTNPPFSSPSDRVRHVTSSITVPQFQDNDYPQQESVGQQDHRHYPADSLQMLPTSSSSSSTLLDRGGVEQQINNLQAFGTSPTTHSEQAPIRRRPSFAPIRSAVEESSNGRPVIAPVEWSSDTMQDILPPRRELPFPKPSTAPRSSTVFSPLPQPRYASSKPDSANTGQQGQEHGGSDPSFEPRSRDRVLRISTPSGPTRFEPPADRMYDLRGNNQENVASDQYSASDHTAEMTRPSSRSMTSSSPLPSISHSRAAIHDLRQPGVGAHTYVHDSVINAVNTTKADDDDEELRRYAEQDADVRMDVLNKFIMDNLDNEDFIKLCDDVGACWRRKVLDRRG